MATMDTQILPGISARKLFNQMVARADDLHLSLANTLELAVERTRSGRNDSTEIVELQSQQWIRQAEDGGWLLLS